jgi:hypothetical protein
MRRSQFGYDNRMSWRYGLRRQSEAATALWRRRMDLPATVRLYTKTKSGVALRLPPQSKSVNFVG